MSARELIDSVRREYGPLVDDPDQPDDPYALGRLDFADELEAILAAEEANGGQGLRELAHEWTLIGVPKGTVLRLYDTNEYDQVEAGTPNFFRPMRSKIWIHATNVRPSNTNADMRTEATAQSEGIHAPEETPAVGEERLRDIRHSDRGGQ